MSRENPRDQGVRDDFLDYKGNAVVYANAGAGKTTLLVKKMQQDIELEKKHYKYAAMTFTNKAVSQINSKIKNKNPKMKIATIDGFFETEIIDNFIGHIYTHIPNFNYSYKREYQVNSYGDGIQQIRNSNIFGTYSKEKTKQGKNFKYDVVLDILENSKRAREFLTAKYKKFYLDEYQDADKSMHQVFIYIMKNIGIETIFVGDEKQAIYQWRGGFPENLEKIKDMPTVTAHYLTENFRSVNEIVDFSNSFREYSTGEFDTKNKSIYYVEDGNTVKAIRKLIEKGILNLEKGILILSDTNNNIQNLQNQLETFFPGKFKYIPANDIGDCTNSKLMEQIAKYYFDREYNESLFLDELYEGGSREFKRTLRKILDIIRIECTENSIQQVFDLFGVPVDNLEGKLETEILLNVLKNDANKDAYTGIKDGMNYIMTVFNAKGLEFEQVIVTSECCLNRDYKGNLKGFKAENNYVAITRARSKLIILDETGEYRDLAKKQIEVNNNISFDEMVNKVD